jgi:hypothetical protein
MTLGFDQPWYILPIHQFESFQMTMFGWEGTLSAAQTLENAAAKRVIHDGFHTIIAGGLPKAHSPTRRILEKEQASASETLTVGAERAKSPAKMTVKER